MALFLLDHQRNQATIVVMFVFLLGELDRSPTGTGVSARAAIHYARGDISI